MAFRNISRDDVTMSGGALHNASQGILRMTGGWGNVSGPGLFMVRTIFTGTLSAVTMGIVGASCGALVWGTATLPFLVCSCSGFIFGALGFYRDAVRQALINVDRYPRLLQLHLDMNFPWRGWNQYRASELTSHYFRRSWVSTSMLVCAWLTAQPALDEIGEARERELIEAAAQPGGARDTDKPDDVK
ncbi:hypothetical protein AC578_7411 [Pseudocercospora eumusae]|uniref:Uncharacterized protein n=1 Tax=Pseudocercospora eumusae TaxID=321146 RepID=A0A139H339_9PEZI|nr:hypothetical protein AC578_7411 [Pseudocercospora eumusae]